MKKYKIGICAWQLPVEGPASFAIAKELGYDGVHILDQGGASQNFTLNNACTQNIYKECAEKAGMQIHTLQLRDLVQSGNMKSSPQSDSGKLALNSVKKGVEVCIALDIKCLMVENFFDSSIKSKEEFNNTAALLKEANNITSASGVQLIYESFLNVNKTIELYEKSNKAFKLCYDNLNPIKYGFGDPVDELKRYPMEMIDHIHFKDAPEDLLPSALLGTGSGHFYEVCDELKERGFEGWLITYNYYCAGLLGNKYDPLECAATDLNTMRKTFLWR